MLENTWQRIYLKKLMLLEVSNWCPEDQIQLAKRLFDNDNTQDILKELNLNTF